ncbi:MAG: hypothetical protein NTX07_06550 [Solirubrobacterales bacterium]|nr:hypothetical protein [Solirubrobacterales bacterium]
MNSVKAQSAYRVNVIHGSPGPAFLALPGRVDQVEMVEVATNETVLFWEGKPIEAARLAKALKRDLRNLAPDEMRHAWLSEVDPPNPS